MNDNLKINGKEFCILFSSNEIINKIEELSKKINSDYENKSITCIIILKGAFIFAADLIRKFKNPCKIYFARASSYGANMITSGKVKLSMPDIDYHGRDILIIEDIIDSGNTIKAINDKLSELKVNTNKTVALFSKPTARKVEVQVDYTGFIIDDEFIIGYGLDWNEFGRELPDIYREVKY